MSVPCIDIGKHMSIYIIVQVFYVLILDGIKFKIFNLVYHLFLIKSDSTGLLAAKKGGLLQAARY